MEKQIVIDNEKKAKICKDFRTTNVTLWSALTFKTNSNLAKMLRKVALERGGQLVGEYGGKFIPNCQTIHDEANNTMTQVFSPRVKLIADRVSGKVGVYIDEELKSTYQPETLTDFINLQKTVEEAAHQLRQ